MIPDDPIIDSLLRTGRPPWNRDEREPICPVCGSECSTIYKDACNEIVGCDECISTHDAVDIDECFPEGDSEW